MPFCSPLWVATDTYGNSCPQCTGDDDECALLVLPCRCGNVCECILCGYGANLEPSGHADCLPCFAWRCYSSGQPLHSSGFGHHWGGDTFAHAWSAEDRIGSYDYRTGTTITAVDGSPQMYCWPPLCCKHPGWTCALLCAPCEYCDTKCDRDDRDGAGLTAAQRHDATHRHDAVMYQEFSAHDMSRTGTNNGRSRAPSLTA